MKDFAQLRNMRAAYPDNDYMQGVLAPLEHKAYAREKVMENPLNFLTMLPAPVAYYMGKKLGLLGARTPASMDQVFAGWHGAMQGLLRQ
jgi:hypothetical protein